MSTRPITTGTRLGPYEVVGLLGKGGMGEVFRATDVRLKRSVAIKVLTSEWIHDERLRNRFYLEAQILSQLDHPNVCTVHDIGETDGLPYLVMPLIEGETLANVIRRFSVVPRAQRLRYIEQLLDGLEYAHARILHRDIKPANLMIDTQNRLKILDFGLARLIDATQPTVFPDAGTPAYMSPEQCQGLPLDPRTDIFSAGAVLYELLTGSRPFSRPDDVNCAVVMHRILHEAAPPLPASREPADVALQQIIDKALAKDREARFRRAGEMADAVRSVREHIERPEATIVSLPAAAMPRPASDAHGVRRAQIAAGVAALALAALAGAWIGLRPPAAGSAPPNTPHLAIRRSSRARRRANRPLPRLQQRRCHPNRRRRRPTRSRRRDNPSARALHRRGPRFVRSPFDWRQQPRWIRPAVAETGSPAPSLASATATDEASRQVTIVRSPCSSVRAKAPSHPDARRWALRMRPGAASLATTRKRRPCTAVRATAMPRPAHTWATCSTPDAASPRTCPARSRSTIARARATVHSAAGALAMPMPQDTVCRATTLARCRCISGPATATGPRPASSWATCI